MKNLRLTIFVFLVIICLLPISIIAQTTVGKIAGVVVDSETKEPLPGANVIVDGTNLGAASDLNGEFVILNVPVGSYSVIAKYIGYTDMTMINLRVHIGLTTEANFELPAQALAVDAVVIVAERPLVNKNATNTVHIISSEQLDNIPVRGYANVAGLQGGVVKVGETLYIRGGRSDEVAYYIDGVIQNNAYTSGRSGSLIHNSIEEIQVQTGGFNAEYGFANSGIIQVSTKTGGRGLKLSGEVITDEFLSQDEEKLGAYGYGYNIYNLALSGPVPGLNKMKFFVAGENNFFRDRHRHGGLHPTGVDTVTGDVTLAGGPFPTNHLKRWNWNGNVSIDFQQIRFKLGGNSTRDGWRAYNHTYSVWNSENNRKYESETDSYYLKATHTLNPQTFYTATVSYFRNANRNGGYRYWDDVEALGDTTINKYLRSPGNNPKTDGLKAYFSPFGTTPSTWNKNQTLTYGLRADITHQMGRTHEIKLGFDYRLNTIRRYSVNGMRIASARNANPDQSDFDVYKSAYVTNLGFNFLGTEELDSGIDKARKPVIAAFYVQDKLEFRDLIVNIGVRWDYLSTDAPVFANPEKIIITPEGTIDPQQLTSAKSYNVISPRLGFSFPVTDVTVFHAQYGKFSQQPNLQNLFVGYLDFANDLQAGNMTTSANPQLEPIKTTAYEVGFRQQFGSNASLDITAYYKEIRDLVQTINILATPTAYATYVNGDFGTVKGLSASFELRRTQRVAATASYTLMWSSGTGSLANGNFAINWLGSPPQYPTFVAPLDFDQRHTGVINIDFRTHSDDGPVYMGSHILGRVGLNLLYSFSSGRPYTPGHMRSGVFASGPAAQNRPQAEINSATRPFFMQLDAKLDKSFNVAGVDFNAYLWLINVLDRRNVLNVYEQSGEANTDGWLNTSEGQRWAAGDPNAASFYNARINNPTHYAAETARQIRFGMRFNF